MDESFMSTKEFCDRLQISSSTVYRMIKNKMIPAVKFGRRWKIPRSIFDNHDAFLSDYQKIMRELQKIR